MTELANIDPFTFMQVLHKMKNLIVLPKCTQTLLGTHTNSVHADQKKKEDHKIKTKINTLACEP